MQSSTTHSLIFVLQIAFDLVTVKRKNICIIYIYVCVIIYILVLYIYYHCMICMYIYSGIYIYIDSNKGCKYNQQSENVTVIHHMARIHTCPMTPMRLGSDSVGWPKHSFRFSAWCISDPRLGLLDPFGLFTPLGLLIFGMSGWVKTYYIIYIFWGWTYMFQRCEDWKPCAGPNLQHLEPPYSRWLLRHFEVVVLWSCCFFFRFKRLFKLFLSWLLQASSNHLNSRQGLAVSVIAALHKHKARHWPCRP